MKRAPQIALIVALLGGGVFVSLPRGSVLAQDKTQADLKACTSERDKLKQSLKSAAADLAECSTELGACTTEQHCPTPPKPKECPSGGLNAIKAFKEARSSLSVRESAELAQLANEALREKAASAGDDDLTFVKSKLSASKKSLGAASEAVSVAEKKAAAAK